VGVHDAFLDVGGDSLKATLVASRLAATMDVELSVLALFDAPTISELAATIERSGERVSAGRGPNLPMTSA
jgi:hypothetical protein